MADILAIAFEMPPSPCGRILLALVALVTPVWIMEFDELDLVNVYLLYLYSSKVGSIVASGSN